MAELSQTRKRDNYVSRWLWNALGVAGDQQSLWRPPLLRELRDSIIAKRWKRGRDGKYRDGDGNLLPSILEVCVRGKQVLVISRGRAAREPRRLRRHDELVSGGVLDRHAVARRPCALYCSRSSPTAHSCARIIDKCECVVRSRPSPTQAVPTMRKLRCVSRSRGSKPSWLRQSTRRQWTRSLGRPLCATPPTKSWTSCMAMALPISWMWVDYGDADDMALGYGDAGWRWCCRSLTACWLG